METKRNGCAVNVDDDLLWYMYESELGDVSDFEGTIREYVRGYADKGVSDLLFNVFCQVSAIPTKALTFWGDKYYQKTENGYAVDYTKEHHVKHIVDIYGAMKRNPFAALIEQTRAFGMRPWISIRMNDCHCGADKTSRLHGDLFYEAVKNGWVVGDDLAGAYYGRCFDYGVKEVRDRMFAYITEVLDLLDTDGLELDFQREMFCFNYKKDPDCHKIMNDFMRKVRAYADKKGAERGHKIAICVHLPRDIAYDRVFGFDAETWVKESLVDVLVPSSRWENTDSDMPIAAWKRLVAGTDIQIWAGLEAFLAYPYPNTPETLRGFAAQYLDEGADKMYLYNHFRYRARNIERSIAEAAAAGLDADYPAGLTSDAVDQRFATAWRVCSRAEEAKKGVCRHVVTFMEKRMAPAGEERYMPFPMAVNGESRFAMKTGDLSGAACVLYLGVREGSAPAVTVDGKAAAPLGEATDAYPQTRTVAKMPGWKGYDDALGTTYYAYAIAPGAGNERDMVFRGAVTVTYAEIKAIFPK